MTKLLGQTDQKELRQANWNFLAQVFGIRTHLTRIPKGS